MISHLLYQVNSAIDEGIGIPMKPLGAEQPSNDIYPRLRASLDQRMSPKCFIGRFGILLGAHGGTRTLTLSSV